MCVGVQFSSHLKTTEYRPNGSLVGGTRVAESSFHGAAELQCLVVTGGELRSDGLGPTTGPDGLTE